MLESFWQTSHPVFDPLGFLHLALSRAHDDVVSLGADLAIETRPRATCALCLVQDGAAYWAHVGDSRVYQLRGGAVRERTRDHSHVEVLLAEGLITEAEVQGHPMRNFVECCIGGDAAVPEMTIGYAQAPGPGRHNVAVHGRALGESHRIRRLRRSTSQAARPCASRSRRSANARSWHPRRTATTPPRPYCAGWVDVAARAAEPL